MVFKYQLDTIAKELMKNQSEYQIIIALLLPCIRELNLWIITKLTKKLQTEIYPQQISLLDSHYLLGTQLRYAFFWGHWLRIQLHGFL